MSIESAREMRTNLCQHCGQRVRKVYLPDWVREQVGMTSVWMHPDTGDTRCQDKAGAATPTLWQEVDDDA